MGMNLIVEAIDKAFLEKIIRHALKSSYKVFHSARLFQLGQTA
jgi:hypothetical protein